MAVELGALPPEVQRFEAYLRTERRASAHTLRSYLVDLEQYTGYLASQGAGVIPASALLVRGWLAQASASAGATSLARKLSACLLYTSPSPRDRQKSRMPSSA